MRVWNYATQKEVWQRAMAGAMILDWSPDGRYLCAVEYPQVSGSAKVWVFDAQGNVQSRFSRNAVGAVAWAPDSKTLAIGEAGQIEIVSLE